MNWLGAAGKVLERVGEYVAPTVKSDLEELKQNWRSIRVFYADKSNDVDGAQVPQHFNSIIRILLEEESPQGGTGPCLEFFLQNRIFEISCILAEKDSPTGMRKLVLTGLVTLLRNLRVDLLSNMSVHQPIASLLRQLIAELRLLESQLSDGVMLVPGSFELEQTDVTALLSALIDKLAPNPILAAYFLDPLGEPIETQEFLVLTALALQLHFSARISATSKTTTAFTSLTSRIRMSMASALGIAGIPQENLIRFGVFPQQIALLGTAFTNLAKRTSPVPSDDNELVELRSITRFIANCTQHAQATVQTHIVDELDGHFLDSRVRPLISTPATLRPTLDLLRTPVMDEASVCPLLTRVFSFFLLGDPQEPYALRQQLESYLADQSSPLCSPSLRLAELLLFCADSIALETLVCPYFPPPPATLSTAYRTTALASSVQAWRALLPSSLSPEEAVKAESNYRNDSEARLRVLRTQQAEAAQVAWGTPAAKPPGPLLSAVFARIGRWADLEMDESVMVTSLCAVLAQQPHPSVHALLLDPAGTLFAALKQASDTAKAHAATIPDYPTQMRAAKAALEASGEDKTSLPRPLLALVMLQEFVLEMTAVLQLSPQVFVAPTTQDKRACAAAMGSASNPAELIPCTHIKSNFELAAYRPGTALVRDIAPVFPSIPPGSSLIIKPEGAIDIFTRSEDVELEKERLLITWAEPIIDRLKAQGFWADITDPASGYPVFTQRGSAAFSEVDGAQRLHAWDTVQAGGCFMLRHPRWGVNVYPASLFTNAPLDALAPLIHATRS